MQYWFPIIVMLIYYLVVWRRATRRLRPDAVVVRYGPPSNLSPAAARYLLLGGAGIWSGGADARTLAALLADLAFRKQVSIWVEGGKYKVQRTAPDHFTLATDEDAAITDILINQPRAIEFTGPILYTRARFAVEKALWFSLRDRYFTGNMPYRLVGVAAMLLWAIVVCQHAPQWQADAPVIAVALLGGGMAVGTVLTNLLRNSPRLGAAGPWLRPVAPYLVSAALALIVVPLLSNADQAFAIAATAMLTISLVFGVKLQAPTALGRQALDEIAGYIAYLQSVECLRLDRLTAPDQPFGANEHLRYVIALDVRDHWGDNLTSAIDHVLKQEARELARE